MHNENLDTKKSRCLETLTEQSKMWVITLCQVKDGHFCELSDVELVRKIFMIKILVISYKKGG